MNRHFVSDLIQLCNGPKTLRLRDAVHACANEESPHHLEGTDPGPWSVVLIHLAKEIRYAGTYVIAKPLDGGSRLIAQLQRDKRIPTWVCKGGRVQVAEEVIIYKAAGYSILIPHRRNGESAVLVVETCVIAVSRSGGMAFRLPRRRKSKSPFLQVVFDLEQNGHGLTKTKRTPSSQSGSEIDQPNHNIPEFSGE